MSGTGSLGTSARCGFMTPLGPCPQPATPGFLCALHLQQLQQLALLQRVRESSSVSDGLVIPMAAGVSNASSVSLSRLQAAAAAGVAPAATVLPSPQLGSSASAAAKREYVWDRAAPAPRVEDREGRAKDLTCWAFSSSPALAALLDVAGPCASSSSSSSLLLPPLPSPRPLPLTAPPEREQRGEDHYRQSWQRWQVAQGAPDARVLTPQRAPAPRSGVDEQLVSRVKAAMSRYGYKQIDVMRDSGVSNTVLCHWLQGKYKGDNNKVSERLTVWLTQVEELCEWRRFVCKRKHLSMPLFMDYDCFGRWSSVDRLVPIRISVSVDGRLFEDACLWNLGERHVSPDWFATTLCDDAGLPTSFAAPIAESIRRRLTDANMALQREAAWEQFVERLAEQRSASLLVLRVDLTLGGVRVQDALCWDVYNPRNSPEQYAASFCRESGLGGDWSALIAHELRRQIANVREQIMEGHCVLEDFETVTTPAEKPFRSPQLAKQFQPLITLPSAG